MNSVCQVTVLVEWCFNPSHHLLWLMPEIVACNYPDLCLLKREKYVHQSVLIQAVSNLGPTWKYINHSVTFYVLAACQ